MLDKLRRRFHREPPPSPPPPAPPSHPAGPVLAADVRPGAIVSIPGDSSVRLLVGEVFPADDGHLLLHGTSELDGSEVSLRAWPDTELTRREPPGL